MGVYIVQELTMGGWVDILWTTDKEEAHCAVANSCAMEARVQVLSDDVEPEQDPE